MPWSGSADGDVCAHRHPQRAVSGSMRRKSLGDLIGDGLLGVRRRGGEHRLDWAGGDIAAGDSGCDAHVHSIVSSMTATSLKPASDISSARVAPSPSVFGEYIICAASALTCRPSASAISLNGGSMSFQVAIATLRRASARVASRRSATRSGRTASPVDTERRRNRRVEGQRRGVRLGVVDRRGVLLGRM